jgi:hypothetical protein
MLALSSLTSLLLPLLLLLLRRRLGCGQPRCVTLFSALAAPPAHLLAAGLLSSAQRVQALQLGPTKRRFFLACQEAFSLLEFLRLLLSPFHICLQ